MLEHGRVVRSIAGHDKDSFYCIVEVSGDRISIADGKLRRLEKPKRKNPLHLRPTKTILSPENMKTDKQLRAALRPFNNATAAGEADQGGNQFVQSGCDRDRG